MEVLPFMGFAFACCLYGSETRKLLTASTEPGDWTLKLKNPRLPIPYFLAIGALILLGGAIPYANETWRCLKQLRAPKRNTGFYKDIPGRPEQGSQLLTPPGSGRGDLGAVCHPYRTAIR